MYTFGPLLENEAREQKRGRLLDGAGAGAGAEGQIVPAESGSAGEMGMGTVEAGAGLGGKEGGEAGLGQNGEGEVLGKS